MFRSAGDLTRLMTRRDGLRAAPLTLGRYPTPVERIAHASLPADGPELWVKRDDRTHDVCGGNKVRKLEWLIADAMARGARRLWTVGAAGSHHVLTTTYFGALHGLEVDAVLTPQPRTEHALEVLRASLALGLHVTPVSSWTAASGAVLARLATRGFSDERFLTLGGSSPLGSMGYVTAAQELADQVRAGAMPEPDVCVVALGSGGTAAGLTAGFAAAGLKTRVVGVRVSQPGWPLRVAALWLARACARQVACGRPEPQDRRSLSLAAIRARLTIDSRFLGPGYGHATPEGNTATRVASEVGLTLDPTYTAKAFAAALELARRRRQAEEADQADADRTEGSRPDRPGVVLYWHTLSSAPLAPLYQEKSIPELGRVASALL